MDLYNCLHFSTAAIITGQLKSALKNYGISTQNDWVEWV